MKMNNKKRGLAMCLIAMLMITTAAGASGGQNAEAKAKPVLNKKKVSLAVGGKVTLKLKNWKKRVTWSSSKKSVATVSGKGVVKAKNKGTAKITAKAGGKKYVCRVNVTKTSKSSVATSRPVETRMPIVAPSQTPIVVATRKPTEAPTRKPIVMPTPVTPAGTTARPSAKPVQNPGNEADYAEQVLALVNAARAEEGLSPLVLDPAICTAATVRAQEIIGTFSHTRPNGTSCFTVLDESGISYMAAGENIAAGQSTPEAVMTAWMDSPGHRANILSSSFRKLGVGFVESESGYKYYWTQLFTG